MTYSARRPYQKLRKSLVDFFKEPVRFLKESNEKESAFEKPYGDEWPEYQAMHVDLPVPDWPSTDPMKLPPFSGKVGGETENEGVEYSTRCRYCIIVCYGDVGEKDKCDEAYGWCHISVACTQDPQLGKPNPGDVHWFVEGPVREVVEDNVDGIDVYVDWGSIKAEDGKKVADFTATLIDGLGNICEADFTVTCPEEEEDCCDTADPVSWDDDNSAETIARNSSVSVAVKDGCPPFSWSVSGTGFSLSSSSTTGRTNTLSASGSACGTAIITVIDDCGNSCTGLVTCTTGRWHTCYSSAIGGCTTTRTVIVGGGACRTVCNCGTGCSQRSYATSCTGGTGKQICGDFTHHPKETACGEDSLCGWDSQYWGC